MFVHPARFFEDRTFSVAPRSCFVIMPFTAAWSDEVYAVVREAVEAADYSCRRADEARAGVIMSDIWRQINEAEVVLADLTGDNPNVYYELGLAHALGKEVIPIVQVGTRVPFDQQVFRMLFYERSSAGMEILRASLPSWIGSLTYSTSPSVILRTQDVQRFNEWRSRRERLRLSSEDFSRLSLSGLDFHDVHMTDGVFSSAVLDEANFTDSVLIRTDFRASTFRRASMRRANFSECNLSFTQMNEADLAEAILIRAKVEQSSLEGSVISTANFSEASLRFTSLDRADLSGAVLVRADIEGASFTGANVDGAIIDVRTLDRNRERLAAAVNFDAMIITTD